MDAKECFVPAEEIFLAKIEKFINIQQNSFLVLSATLHGARGMETDVQDSVETPG